MKKILLGSTGIEVTELCFGALPIGPLQKNMHPEESAEVVAEALRSGINFVDTAQMYKTYEPICIAMKKTEIRPVIATKSTAATYEEMEEAIHEALDKLDIEVIDIFLLHAARMGADVFELRKEALKCLLDYKNKGIIKAVGISTHMVETVKKSAENPDIDIVFPIINKTGMGILGGMREEMEVAVNECLTQRKGVYLMKALAGGNLIGDYMDALNYIRGFANGKASISMGMVSKKEVEMNIGYFNDVDISEQAGKLKKSDKEFYISPVVCRQCRKCADVCHNNAISDDTQPVIDTKKCLQCGYCVSACPQFAIRMI